MKAKRLIPKGWVTGPQSDPLADIQAVVQRMRDLSIPGPTEEQIEQVRKQMLQIACSQPRHLDAWKHNSKDPEYVKTYEEQLMWACYGVLAATFVMNSLIAQATTPSGAIALTRMYADQLLGKNPLDVFVHRDVDLDHAYRWYLHAAIFNRGHITTEVAEHKLPTALVPRAREPIAPQDSDVAGDEVIECDLEEKNESKTKAAGKTDKSKKGKDPERPRTRKGSKSR